MPSVKEISPSQLMRLLGTPDCPRSIDVCIDTDFQDRPQLIPGAGRMPHTDLPAILDHVQNQSAVVTCLKKNRIACPWLIRRSVDSQARFQFLARCTFDTMLEKFDPRTKPLTRRADVIQAADTDNHDICPQAAGLALYDALFRWARDGFSEGHNWPAARN